MHIRLTRQVALAALTLVFGVVMGEVADAQAREFVGKVVSSGATLTVEDRRGERLGFTRTEKTVVEGRSGWSAIAVGDQVLVRWVLADGRMARRVIVLEKGS
jgi:hypothetical protein